MNDLPTFTFENGQVAVRIDLRNYRLAAVKKAGYRFADKFTLALEAQVGNEVPVRLLFKSTPSEAQARELTRLFLEELLDQELREQIAEETQPVRALILAHAFSRTNLIRNE